MAMGKNLFGDDIQSPDEEVEIETKGIAKPKLFDFINDLMAGKKYLYEDSIKSAYSPFMVNRAMSQHPDLIMYANEMNKAGHQLDKRLHHDFYFYGVSRKKRFGKWAKAEKENDDLKFIIDLYKVNRVHAQQYLDILTKDELKQLKDENSIGGSK